MKLTKVDKSICEEYRRPDSKGLVHCHDCPLAVCTGWCKANMSAKQWRHCRMYGVFAVKVEEKRSLINRLLRRIIHGRNKR